MIERVIPTLWSQESPCFHALSNTFCIGLSSPVTERCVLAMVQDRAWQARHGMKCRVQLCSLLGTLTPRLGQHLPAAPAQGLVVGWVRGRALGTRHRPGEAGFPVLSATGPSEFTLAPHGEWWMSPATTPQLQSHSRCRLWLCVGADRTPSFLMCFSCQSKSEASVRGLCVAVGLVPVRWY